MSVSGLYDSEKGDALARKSLAPFRKIDTSEIDDEVFYKPTRRLCECGRGMISKPYIVRGGRFVCVQCAKETKPGQGGAPVANSCSRCRSSLPRRLLKVKKGALYCARCMNEV